MTRDRLTGVAGIGMLVLFAAFLLVYAVSLVRHHHNQQELVLGWVMICGLAPAILLGIILVTLAFAWAT